MTDDSYDKDLLYDEATGSVTPVEDEQAQVDANVAKNYKKVGGARASTLLYTYGPGAVMDMPHFTVMPMGLDDWDRVYAKRPGFRSIHAPRLLENVQIMLGYQVKELKPYPWQPQTGSNVRQNTDLGVPAQIFPQWLRCTDSKCSRLLRVSDSELIYKNDNPWRPDQAEFTHRHRAKGKDIHVPCVPARYLLVCPDGHMDEFPYDWWVHRGEKCEKAPEHPLLKMIENTHGISGSSIVCASCGARRSMGEAQGTNAADRLPRCRGRIAHLNCFKKRPCDKQPRLMLIGASNLWFPVSQSIVDMPQRGKDAEDRELIALMKKELGPQASLMNVPVTDVIISIIHGLFQQTPTTPSQLKDLDQDRIRELIQLHQSMDESEEERQRKRTNWDPIDLLVPEWQYLDRDFPTEQVKDDDSGLVLHRQGMAESVHDAGVRRILAVDKLRKVNALIGFTRIDDFDRANDLGSRMVRLSRRKPTWVPATEDRGEGMFIQFDEERIAAWEKRVLESDLWDKHREAHRRNYANRLSETAKKVDPDTRLPYPRYWLMHTFAHALIKRMAMSSGYGIPSISERIYAWPADDERPAAAGVMIVTTASDSDGTLGGLVSLSEEHRFARIMRDALHEALRCSSDPVCAQRTPKDPEDFLHGAACHCCCMLSETSCERANRFLDRRFLVPLPGEYTDLAFFGRD